MIFNRAIRSFYFLSSRKYSSYAQGQTSDKNIREYFYFIDHQGMLFLDDSKMKNFTSCFKDKEFLIFFFKRVRPNKSERYSDFPYISLCGHERNYIRVDDTPLVYTHMMLESDKDVFCYNHIQGKAHNMFEPEKLIMSPSTGRVYHPCQERFGSVGLVRSALAIEFSKMFIFENGDEKPPTKFTWKGTTYDLDLSWYFEHRKKI